MRWIARISLLLLGLLPSGLVSVPEVQASTVEGIDWKPCPDDETVECGKVSVPIDWARPSGAKVDIVVARVRAGDPKDRIGSLFLLPGGPGGSGGSGVNYVVFFARDFLAPEILRRFDIVGFDARGVRRSHPVLCPTDDNPPSEYPRGPETYRRLVAYHQRLAEGCRRLTGTLFDHVDTLSVVRDTDAIRGALGQRQISLQGESYGTLLGQQYAEEYPRRVRALSLDSNMDHSITSTRGYLIPTSEALEQAYSQFAAWCATSPRCALRGQDPLKVLDELMAKADRGELNDPDKPGSKLAPEDLSETIRRALYSTRDWVSLATYLSKLRTGTPSRPWARSEERPYEAVLCSDFSFPVRDFEQLDGHMAASRRAAPHTRVNPLAWTDITKCQGFLPRPRNPQRPYRIQGTPPILVTNSRYDVATPYPWAVSVARQIPGAVLLTYDGVGHSVYTYEPCTTAAIDRYLLTLETPLPGTHCPAMPLPSTGGR
ncbi:alpha/beta hydrolase [Actinomadura rubrisoli]|uniref:Alpha/beta hydrolase n=1 Tax=Actinomadura rubrisoli TaxID=2530368 RepID=A0A4V2YTD4_9ACTN|nr:alpha/beta hydrolase [Actinomadura rubrisoli]TDD73377.1 alpha/beta hydrolase [Actinomadura rubrisoli]